jgi:transcriptional regulator with XRE-family HTH domain
MKNLKLFRTIQGMNQLDLAAKTKICQTTLSLIESGRREPTPAQRKTLSIVLEVEEAILFPPQNEDKENG